MNSTKIVQSKSLNEERNNFLKCIVDILYLKHKEIPYPKIEIPDYFNIQTSDTTLTINATKGGIDQFLKRYGSLKKPPEVIDLTSCHNPNRIWGSRRVVPAEKRFPNDISPYRAISPGYSRSPENYYIVVDSLKINFIETSSEEVILYATGPYPEGHYKEIDKCDFYDLSVKIWWDHFDHDFSRRVGDSTSEKFKWIFGPLLKITKESTKKHSLAELKKHLSKYGSVEDLSERNLSLAVSVIESSYPEILDIFNKVYHPELTVNQKGWQQFIELLKIFRDKKDWFFVTHLYKKKDKNYPFQLTTVLNEKEKPFVFKDLEFIRPEIEKVPCIRTRELDITGNCHGLLIVAKWLKDFALSCEKNKFILNQWRRIPNFSLKPGYIESDQWILIEKFEETLDEPFFSAEVDFRDRKNCLLLRGNYNGFLKVAERLEQHAFTAIKEGYSYGYEGKKYKNKSIEYFKKRMVKELFLIGCAYIHGGFKFSLKYEPLAQYAIERSEANYEEDDLERMLELEDFDGYTTHIIERSEQKYFEVCLDKKNKFLKERIIKSDDCI